MVDVKISELPVADQANVDDLIEASQVSGAGYVSRHISLDQVSTVVANSDQVHDVIDDAIALLPDPVSDWADITGKPATFPPTVPIAWTDVSGKPATFPPDAEAVDDRVAALLVAGTNITLAYNDPANTLTINSTASGGGAGTVTSVSVVNANGLAGTVATPTATPAITLSTTVNGMLKGNGTAISAATAGTDYVTPGGLPTSLPPSGAASGDLTGTYPSPTIKANVALTGNPTAPTPGAGDNDTSIATTAFVQTTLAANGFRLLQRTAVVSAVADVNIQNIPADINDLRFSFDLTHVANTTQSLLQFYNNTGALVTTSGQYTGAVTLTTSLMAAGATPFAIGGNGAGITHAILLTYSGAGNNVSNTMPIRGSGTICNIRAAGRPKTVDFQCVHLNDGATAWNIITGSGVWGISPTAVTGFRIVAGGGNIASGAFSVWGSP